MGVFIHFHEECRLSKWWGMIRKPAGLVIWSFSRFLVGVLYFSRLSTNDTTKLGTFQATVTTFHLFTLDAGLVKRLQQLVKHSPVLFIELASALDAVLNSVKRFSLTHGSLSSSVCVCVWTGKHTFSLSHTFFPYCLHPCLSLPHFIFLFIFTIQQLPPCTFLFIISTKAKSHFDHFPLKFMSRFYILYIIIDFNWKSFWEP